MHLSQLKRLLKKERKMQYPRAETGLSLREIVMVAPIHLVNLPDRLAVNVSRFLNPYTGLIESRRWRQCA